MKLKYPLIIFKEKFCKQQIFELKSFFFSENGFWTRKLSKYHDKRRIEIYTRRQIFRYNYDNHLNNTNATIDFNRYLIDEHQKYASSSINSLRYTQNDILEYFFEKDHSILDLTALLPIFIVWCLGIVATLIVFGLELLYFHFKK